MRNPLDRRSKHGAGVRADRNIGGLRDVIRGKPGRNEQVERGKRARATHLGMGVGRRSHRGISHPLGPHSTDELLDASVLWALVWALWTGRSFLSTESRSANMSQTEVESVPKIVNSSPVGILPPLPAENIASLRNAMRIKRVEVTPLDIIVTRLDLIRSIDPTDWRREDSASLVIRLKLKNISTNDTFAPLEPHFVREQALMPDRSTIATSSGQGINLFPLAVDSEWSIVGQDFTVLQPGESVETLIASEPEVAAKLTDDMTWRVRLRIGPYRTDVLGVRFKIDDLEDGSIR